MRTHGKAIGLVTLLLAGVAFADVSVKEEVDEGPVGVGDAIQVRVAVQGAQGAIQATLPPGDFQLLGTSRSSSIEMRSGTQGTETSRTEQITFTVAARRAGTLSIPAAQVTVDGAALEGQPAQVEVQAGRVARAPKTEDDGDDADTDPFAMMRRQMQRFGMNDPFMKHLLSGDPFADQGLSAEPIQLKPGDVRLLAVPDRKTASVGEQLTVSYYLVTRVPLSGISDLQIPAIDGAATHDIELGKHLSQEQQGDEVRVLIARKALFPDLAGRLTIKPATARITAGSLVGGQEVAVASSAVSVTIVPLPKGPTPGAIGSWALSLTGPAEAHVGQPATIRVSARGTGDLDSLPTPDLHAPASWKVFPPSTQEQARVANGLVGGTRTWDFVVLPVEQGEANFPSVHLATFDPRTHRYGTAESAPWALHVDPAPPAPPPLEVSNPPVPVVSPVRSVEWLGWAVALIALATLAAVIIRRSRVSRPGGSDRPRSPRGEAQLARSHLERARGFCASAQAAPFFEALTRALDALVTDLGATPKEDTSALAADLQRNGVSSSAIGLIQRAIETCRRFAFVRSDDLATMRRTLTLADQAFAALPGA